MVRILAPLFLMATPVLATPAAASEGTLPGQPWWLAAGLALLAMLPAARPALAPARAKR